MREHLRAAQGWLKKAEHSFEEKKTVRAELDLMLAQAELRRAQERKRDPKTRARHRLYRQAGALFCAVLLVGFGMFCRTLLTEEPAEAVYSPVRSVVIPNETSKPVEQNGFESSTMKVESASVSNVTEKAQESTPIVGSTHTMHDEPKAASHIAISREEMQELVQAAGKSLRGQ